MQTQTLTQQAQEWLDNRAQAMQSQRDSGIHFTFKSTQINPLALPQPLQSEVLRLLDNPKQD
jgi:hypothetical protein